MAMARLLRVALTAGALLATHVAGEYCDFSASAFDPIESSLTACEKAQGTNLTGLLFAPVAPALVEKLCACSDTVASLANASWPNCTFQFGNLSVVVEDHFQVFVRQCQAEASEARNKTNATDASDDARTIATTLLPNESPDPAVEASTAPDTVPVENQTHKKSRMSTGAIAGAVVGALALFALVAVFAVCWCRQRRRRRAEIHPPQQQSSAPLEDLSLTPADRENASAQLYVASPWTKDKASNV